MEEYIDSQQLLLENLMRYADHNLKFNRKFLDGCFDFKQKQGYLTEKQMILLKKIYKENDVDEFNKNRYG